MNKAPTLLVATLLPGVAETDERHLYPMTHIFSTTRAVEEDTGTVSSILLASAHTGTLSAAKTYLEDMFSAWSRGLGRLPRVRYLHCPFEYDRQKMGPDGRRSHEIAFCKRHLVEDVRTNAKETYLYFFDSDLTVDPSTVSAGVSAAIPGRTFVNIPYCLRDQSAAPGEQFGCHIVSVTDIHERAVNAIYQTERHPNGQIGVVGADDCNFRVALLEQGLKEVRMEHAWTQHFSIGDPKVPDGINVYSDGKCGRLPLGSICWRGP